MHSQATTYARLAESAAIKNSLSTSSIGGEKIDDKLQVAVLPISAEDAGLLPNRGGNDRLLCVVGCHLHCHLILMLC